MLYRYGMDSSLIRRTLGLCCAAMALHLLMGTSANDQMRACPRLNAMLLQYGIFSSTIRHTLCCVARACHFLLHSMASSLNPTHPKLMLCRSATAWHLLQTSVNDRMCTCPRLNTTMQSSHPQSDTPWAYAVPLRYDISSFTIRRNRPTRYHVRYRSCMDGLRSPLDLFTHFRYSRHTSIVYLDFLPPLVQALTQGPISWPKPVTGNGQGVLTTCTIGRSCPRS